MANGAGAASGVGRQEEDSTWSFTTYSGRSRLRERWSGRTSRCFPLVQPNGHDPSYALIDELLEGGHAEISELDEHGAVGTISVHNRAAIDALILDGTELRGAKQNRMVNVTVIVGKGTDTPIPVSCVEQGRWAYRSRHFSSAKRTVASRLRNLKAHMVSEHLARTGRARTRVRARCGTGSTPTWLTPTRPRRPRPGRCVHRSPAGHRRVRGPAQGDRCLRRRGGGQRRDHCPGPRRSPEHVPEALGVAPARLRDGCQSWRTRRRRSG